MKALTLTGIRDVKIVDMADPEIKNPDDVLLKIKMVGICGSDVHYYTTGRIGCQVVEYPFVVGHECAAVVEAVGSAVKSLKTGDRVAVDPAMPCHSCDQCKVGRENTCRKLRFLGCPGQAEGCLSEYLVMPEKSCFKISDAISFERAVISEPLAIGIYACKLAGDLKNKKIGIMGAGPIGLSVALGANAYGTDKIYISEPVAERRVIAEKAGACKVYDPKSDNIIDEIKKDEPLLLDYVFEAAGEQESFDASVETLKPGGKLLLIGIPEFDRYSFKADHARRNELCIQHVRRQNACVEETLSLLEGKINPDFMVTHYFDFKDSKKGFDLVDRYEDGVVKAMIVMPS